MYTYNDVFKNKENVLFVTAHPDDSIVFFGGLIHKLRQDNKNVFALVVTNGARGSRENHISEEELSKKRIHEEVNALGVLGVPKENCFSLHYKDGEVESDLKLIGEIAKYLRKFKIDLVATHEPSLMYIPSYKRDGFFVQHRDHRKVGEAVLDAVYPFSRDRSFFTEHYAEGIEPHTVLDILLTDENKSNFEYDFTDTVEIKRRSMKEHQSQFSDEVVEQILNSWKFGDRYIEKLHYVNLFW